MRIVNASGRIAVEHTNSKGVLVVTKTSSYVY